MENTKKIEINDFDRKLYFKIRLFGVEEGLDYVDRLAGTIKEKSFSVKPHLRELLPLASAMDIRGDKVVKEEISLEDCYATFQNPLAVIELGMRILEFQSVFMESSELFRPYLKILQSFLNTQISASETK